MKKIIALFLTFTILLLTVGCGKSEMKDNEVTTTTETTTESTTESTAKDETTTESVSEESTTFVEESTTKAPSKEETTKKNKPTTTKAETTTKKAVTTTIPTTTRPSNIVLEGNNELHFTNSMSKVINDEFLRLVNEERKKCGVQPLTINNTLMEAAKTRGSEAVQYYSHTRPDGSAFFTVLYEPQHYYGYTIAGENLGKTYSYHYNDVDLEMNYTAEDLKVIAKDFFEGWKSSEGHYKNMISEKYTETGFYFLKYYNEETTEYGTVGIHIFGDQ